MKSPLQIGITGGIGTGKSLVSRIFAILGVPVYDADSRAGKLMNEDASLIADIKKNLGEESYNTDGSVNRAYLRALAFGSEEKIKTLNALVHPRVADDYLTWAAAQSTDAPYLLKEAALLYEAGSDKGLDGIIVVTATEQLRIKRVLQRDPHRSEDDIRKIISNQLPEAGKIKRADFIIVNDETTLLIPQVLALHATFCERSKKSR